MSGHASLFPASGRPRCRGWLALLAIVLALAGRMGDVAAAAADGHAHAAPHLASEDAGASEVAAAPPCEPGTVHTDHHACQAAPAAAFVAVEASAEDFVPPHRTGAAMRPEAAAPYRSRDSGPDFRPPKPLRTA